MVEHLRVEKVAYRVWSVSDENGEHYVTVERGNWKCISCLEFLRKRSCPHIRRVWEYLKEERKWDGSVVSAEGERKEQR